MKQAYAEKRKSDSAKVALEDKLALMKSIDEIKNSKVEEKTKLETIQRKSKTIGDIINGGIIFYIDQTADGGLVVAQNDQFNGKTDLNTANKYFESDSLQHWRLPSIGELKLIYDLRIGGLNTSGLYWSSTQVGNNVYLINFSNGSTSYRYSTTMGHSFFVRAVRNF